MAAKFGLFVDEDHSKVSKGAKIRNRYNQVPHLSQDTSFLRYTGYLNFINGPNSRVLLLILVHVQLLSCLFF